MIVTLARIAYSNGLSTGLKNSFENKKNLYILIVSSSLGGCVVDF